VTTQFRRSKSFRESEISTKHVLTMVVSSVERNKAIQILDDTFERTTN